MEMISVIICTYKRCESLRGTLRSLAEMRVPAHLAWEVIVVDNKCDDGTRDVVELFKRNSGIAVGYAREPNLGLSNARNRGISEARGDVLSFIDDDVRVTPNWLTELKSAFHRHDAICLGGKVLLHTSFPKPRWWDDWCEIPCGKFDEGESIFFAGSARHMVGIGANISFRRSAFNKYGLFKPGLGRCGKKLLMGEETEFCSRLQSQGERLMYVPSVVVYHHPELTRFTKNYIRRWFYRIGEWHQFEDRGAQRTVPAILGVALWRYRSAAAELLHALTSYCQGNSKKAFRHETRFIEFLGRLVCSLKAPFSQETNGMEQPSQNETTAFDTQHG